MLLLAVSNLGYSFYCDIFDIVIHRYLDVINSVTFWLCGSLGTVRQLILRHFWGRDSVDVLVADMVS